MYCQSCGTENQQGVSYCSGCGTAFSHGQASQRKNSDERKALLARQIANMVPRGWRVESQGDYQAVLVTGKSVNHVLHLILTLITCFIWGIVWAALVIFGGEKREIAEVDEWGNVNLTRSSGTSSKVIAGVGVALGVIIFATALVLAANESTSSELREIFESSKQSGSELTLSTPTVVPAETVDQETSVETGTGQDGSTSLVITNTPKEVVSVNAERILSDYRTNKTAANFNFTGKDILLFLDNIDRIEEGGRVQKSLPFGDSSDSVLMELDFSKQADVVDLIPGDTVTALCKFDGYDTLTSGLLEFRDCSRHVQDVADSEPANPAVQNDQGSISTAIAEPTESLAEVRAEEILEDYHIDESVADSKYKDKQVLVVLDDIEHEEDGRVQKSLLFDFDTVVVQLEFPKNADVIDLIPGDTVTALCKFDGYDASTRSRLEFRDCERRE